MSSNLTTDMLPQQQAQFREIRRTITIPCRLGLHLRVAALVVTLTRQFQSEIHFTAGRRRVNAKSIVGMLELGAVRGRRLSLVAQGPDAERAIQVLAELFESKDVLCKERKTNEEAHDGSPRDRATARL